MANRRISSTVKRRAMKLARQVGVTNAARISGVDRNTITRWLREDDARIRRENPDPNDHRTPEEREASDVVDGWEAIIARRWRGDDIDRAMALALFAMEWQGMTEGEVPGYLETVDLPAAWAERTAYFRTLAAPLPPDLPDLIARAEAFLEENPA